MGDTEIDSLIATEIMGWELLEVDYSGTPDETKRQRELEDWIDGVGIESIGEYWINVETRFWMEKENWIPTHKVAQAWAVFSKFPWKDWDILICRNSDNGWSVEISRWNKSKRFYEEQSIAKAICLAVLGTLEAEDEQ